MTATSPLCTDSVLILAAYARWGKQLIEHLEGQFSFAVLDGRAKSVFACTDHLGSLPLIFSKAGPLLHLASDMETMLRRLDSPRVLNEKALVASIQYSFRAPATETFHQGIEALPPGTFLQADSANVRLTRYWVPSIRPELIPAKPDDVYETARHLVESAVANRIGQKRQVAIKLSGGLDSTALAAVAAQYLRRGNRSLVALVGVNDPANQFVPDERLLAEQLRVIDNLELQFVDARGTGPFDGFDNPKSLETAAYYQYAPFMVRALNAAAASCGAELLLSGGGGEFTVSNRPGPLLLERLFSLRWRTMTRELRQRSARNAVSGLRLLASEAVNHVWQRRDRNLTFFPGRGLLRQHSPEWRRRAPWWPDCRTTLLAQTTQFLDRQTLIATCSQDRVFNPSFPFFDKNLLEFCLALPADFKERDGQDRYVIRKAFSPLLPPSMRFSKMWGSPDFFFRYNAQIDKARALVRAIRKSDPVREIVDVDRLEREIFPIQNPLAGQQYAGWTVPHSLTVIGFLRQFSAFRV